MNNLMKITAVKEYMGGHLYRAWQRQRYLKR